MDGSTGSVRPAARTYLPRASPSPSSTGSPSYPRSTPYAGALPGSFKNLLDWTVGGGELYRKPVAWINVAAEGRGGNAHASLATVLGYLGAEVLESACVRLPVPRSVVGPEESVSDPRLRSQIAQALTEVARELQQRRQAQE